MPSEDNAVHIGNKKTPQWRCRCGYATNNANRMFCVSCKDAAPRGVRQRAIEHRDACAARSGSSAARGGAHSSYCAAAKAGANAKNNVHDEVIQLRREMAALKRQQPVSDRPSPAAAKHKQHAEAAASASKLKDFVSPEAYAKLLADLDAAAPEPEPPEPPAQVIGKASRAHEKVQKRLNKQKEALVLADKQLETATTKKRAIEESIGELEAESSKLLAELQLASASAGSASQDGPLLAPVLAGLDEATRQHPAMVPVLAALEAALAAIPAARALATADTASKAAPAADAPPPEPAETPTEKPDSPMGEQPSPEEFASMAEDSLGAAGFEKDPAAVKRLAEANASAWAKRAKKAAEPQQP